MLNWLFPIFYRAILKSLYLFMPTYIMIEDIDYIEWGGYIGGYGYYNYNQLLLSLTSLRISFD